MKKTCAARCAGAVLASSLLLAAVAGCATKSPSAKPTSADVWMLDGDHVLVIPKAEALAIPALAAVAAKCESNVVCATETGFDLMYGLDIHPPE